MLRSLLVLAALTAVAAPAFAASDDDLRKAIIGTWGNTPACDDQELVFRADGTFTMHSASDPNDEQGTYQISGGHLTGSSGGNAMPDMVVQYDGKTLAFQDPSGDSEPVNPCPPYGGATSTPPAATTTPAQ